jgi:hypothetical protein
MKQILRASEWQVFLKDCSEGGSEATDKNGTLLSKSRKSDKQGFNLSFIKHLFIIKNSLIFAPQLINFLLL